jgi:hypothetical protein
MKIVLNVNDNVHVRLTEFGIEQFKKWHNATWSTIPVETPDSSPPIDKDGWSKFQLWVLMDIFGSVMYNGGPVPFETEIEFRSLL